MGGDIIEQMRMRAIDVLRSHGWTVTDMSGEGYAQLDEAIKSSIHMLLQDMQKKIVLEEARMAVELYAHSIGMNPTQK